MALKTTRSFVKRVRSCFFGQERLADPLHIGQYALLSMQVVTTPLSLARDLWRYGEDDLVVAALVLSAEQVADIGARAGALMLDPDTANAIWPGLPRQGFLLIAALEVLAGSARPAKRSRRRAEKAMPVNLVASEAARWADPMLAEVTRVVDERNRRRI